MSDQSRKSDDAPSVSASSGATAAPKPQRKMPKGRPWQKGQSGNPSGRRPVLADIREKYMSNVEGLLGALLLAAHKDLKSGKTSAAVAAAHEFLDRITGKAPQPIVGQDGGAPINVNAPDLVAALRRIAERESDDPEGGPSGAAPAAP